MGCILSRKHFVANENVQGQDKAALEVFDFLGLTANDIDLLYTAFWDIDADGSGLIKPIELFAYFEVESTPFEKHVFMLFDEDNSGLINFMEFVCVLWNLLTLPEPALGLVAYLMKDHTGKKFIKYGDAREILEIMHKKKVDADPSLQMVMQIMKKVLPVHISIEDFCKFTVENPSTTSPLLMLQLHLRLQVIGEKFWAAKANERFQHPEQGKLDYVTKLQDEVMSRNKAFTERQEYLENKRLIAERRGRGIDGDCRDNVTRKQSILLGFFNLKQFSFKRQASLSRGITTSDSAAAATPQMQGNRRRRSLRKPNIVREQDQHPEAHRRKKKYKEHLKPKKGKATVVPTDSGAEHQRMAHHNHNRIDEFYEFVEQGEEFEHDINAGSSQHHHHHHADHQLQPSYQEQHEHLHIEREQIDHLGSHGGKTHHSATHHTSSDKHKHKHNHDHHGHGEQNKREHHHHGLAHDNGLVELR